MNVIAATQHVVAPYIDWRALSPFVVLTAGGLVVLIVGLLRPALIRERIVPALTILTFLCAMAAEIWVYHHHAHPGKGGYCLVAAPKCSSAPLAMDRLALELSMLFAIAGIAAVLMSWRATAPRESGHGEYGGLLVFSVLGMGVFVSAQNLVTLFLGIELLSIPLYILCASETRREASLESGLKYLIVGSVGSATLVYGLALIYGATGSTDFATIGTALSQGKLAGGSLGNPMVYTGLGLTIVGFAFKASVAPFHQWTPDVYEGAPTPITAFMATATKAAALGAFIRFFDVAAIGAQDTWAPMLATLAAITIIVGNVGALGQSSLKRMMGYSGVAQAGYMLTGVVVGTRLGVQATVLYLMAYLAMNLAPFAVIVAEEHERPDGDYLSALAGLGARRPWLAWPMTIGMLALAGIPGTVGFIAKFQLISALVSGAYTWLAIVLVIGSMISLGYYLRVVATIWMRAPVPAPAPAVGRAGPSPGPGELAPIAGGSLEADEWEEGAAVAGAGFAYPELVFVAVGFAAAAVFFG
ncbi:MAG TPA: NADH-quinone oxidoreductase subunit N, partial [Solirubrobacteraceae bacterium]|nr:NADH-quinone oxidoreductase subunit N [Solirubrobacteraceae bacterium]